jgi:hypothetical protein
MKVAVHHLYIHSTSDCSKTQSSTEFMAWKILTSSANKKYLEYLITLLRSLINVLKSQDPETDPYGMVIIIIILL